MSDLHNVIAALSDGTFVLVSGHRPYAEAVEVWDRYDTARLHGLLPGVNHVVVRSVDDPDPRWRNARDNVRSERLVKVMRPTKARSTEAAARAWAKEHGYSGRGGGWIDNPSGHIVCQGWSTFAGRLERNGDIRLIDGTWWVGTSVPRDLRLGGREETAQVPARVADTRDMTTTEILIQLAEIADGENAAALATLADLAAEEAPMTV